jgi:hypothetical protein
VLTCDGGLGQHSPSLARRSCSPCVRAVAPVDMTHPRGPSGVDGGSKTTSETLVTCQFRDACRCSGDNNPTPSRPGHDVDSNQIYVPHAATTDSSLPTPVDNSDTVFTRFSRANLANGVGCNLLANTSRKTLRAKGRTCHQVLNQTSGPANLNPDNGGVDPGSAPGAAFGVFVRRGSRGRNRPV